MNKYTKKRYRKKHTRKRRTRKIRVRRTRNRKIGGGPLKKSKLIVPAAAAVVIGLGTIKKIQAERIRRTKNQIIEKCSLPIFAEAYLYGNPGTYENAITCIEKGDKNFYKGNTNGNHWSWYIWPIPREVAYKDSHGFKEKRKKYSLSPDGLASFLNDEYLKDCWINMITVLHNVIFYEKSDADQINVFLLVTKGGGHAKKPSEVADYIGNDNVTVDFDALICYTSCSFFLTTLKEGQTNLYSEAIWTVKREELTQIKELCDKVFGTNNLLL